jgi:polar amino acid transport system substrate-binding protein
MFLTTPRRRVAWLLVAVAVFVAGCGSSSKKTSSPTAPLPRVAVNSTIAGEVPAAVKSKGTLTVAADATYAPNEFIAPDGHTVIGMDPDLMHELGAVMGLKVKVVNATFASIIPGLAAGKFDIGASSFTDNKVREKAVDFVTYLSVGEAFLTKANGGPKVNILADLCGHTVSVENGTTEQTDATNQDKKCRAAGKPGVKLLVFPDQNGANLALSSGRAEIDFADAPIVAYEVRQLGVQVRQGPTFGFAPYGFALPKGNGMTKPILDALKVLMANGVYKSILTNWQVQAGAITNPTINGAKS